MDLRRVHALGAMLALVVLLAACDAQGEELPRHYAFDAEVQSLGLNGPSAFFLKDLGDADPGAAYFPLNLPGEYQVHGTRVRVEGYVREDLGNIYLMKTFEIRDIERIAE